MVLCVTGPMAAGKNAASALLESRGFATLDADRVVHKILAGAEMQARVVSAFAADAARRGIVLTRADGSLDRRALGALIFRDRALLARQESLVLPEVEKEIRAFIRAHEPGDVAINATVLYKIPALGACRAILYVDAPARTRFFRARRRDGMKAHHILGRFWAQRNLFSKYQNANADIVKVTNTGDLKKLERAIDDFLAVLKNHNSS